MLRPQCEISQQAVAFHTSKNNMTARFSSWTVEETQYHCLIMNTKYNKTIIVFGFCDIWIIKVEVLASADNTVLYLDYSRYTKNQIQ